MMAWLFDVWQAFAKVRYTDRNGITWQFDYYGTQEWFNDE
jgi:hypothetical protein